jgi:hypothetical protein
MAVLTSRTVLLVAALTGPLLACGGGGGSTPDPGTSSSSSSSSSSGSSSSSSGSSSSGSSSSSSSGSTSSSSGGGTNLGANAKIIFLHHSTGGVIWGGGVANSIASYNAAHSTSYQISERSFPSSAYPPPSGGWQNYPYDYWNIWIHGGGGGEPTLETLTTQYNVIVWKHCFPVSNIDPDTGSASVSSSNKTLENYKLQYAALKTKMRSFPNTRFIVWTGSALIQSETTSANATRAQEFANWVKNTWDEKNDNIFVWDFRQLETEGGLYLLGKYSAGDSHPNSTLANTIAPYFAQRIVDVIQGRGDTASITGH